jgi:16S rRNA (guanine527-N7)-methyltransferase
MFHVKQSSDTLRLEQLAAEIKVRLSSSESQLLITHLQLVLEANRSLNLTAINTVGDGIRLHILDSLTVIPELEAHAAGSILDIGSGAGYPGIPIAIMSSARVVLLESRGRRAEFLARALKGLSLENAFIEHSRAEELVFGKRLDRFDIVVARAVSSLPALVELAAPLLKSGGRLIAMKGDLSANELERGVAAGRIVGMSHESTRRFVLPEGHEARTLVTFCRQGKASIRLPRRPGMAQTKPLG